MGLLRRLVGCRRHATAVVFRSSFVALVAPAASAHHGHLSKVKGKWSNPVGACVAHIIKVDPTTGDPAQLQRD